MTIIDEYRSRFAGPPFMEDGTASSRLVCRLKRALRRNPKFLIAAGGYVQRSHPVSLMTRVDGRKPCKRDCNRARRAHAIEPIRQRDAIEQTAFRGDCTNTQKRRAVLCA